MGATIGVVIGVIATIIVSRYYFRRSVNTSLGVYGLLNSYVFAGITDDVRTRLHFRFEGREVQELQQLVFLSLTRFRGRLTRSKFGAEVAHEIQGESRPSTA